MHAQSKPDWLNISNQVQLYVLLTFIYLKRSVHSEKRNFVEGQPIFKSHHPDDMSIYANITLLVFRLLELENELIQISSHWPRVMQEWRPVTIHSAGFHKI